MTKHVILIILAAILLTQSIALAQDNPFISKKPEKNIQYPHFVQKFLREISTLQHWLNQEIAKWVKEVKTGKSVKPVFIILIITFAYGVIHALGPGHGKTVTFSYFLSERADVKKGIIVGTLIGFLHAGSALALVLILYFILQYSFIRPLEDFSRIIKLISYGSITLIGLFLLLKIAIVRSKKNAQKARNIYTTIETTESIIPFAVAVGIIPCPGAVIMLIFAISMDIFVLGIISTIFMALGMAATVSFTGVLSILTRKAFTKSLTKRTRVGSILQTILSTGGAILIIIIGLFLLTGTL
ncbi:MAG: hypothetical protein WBB37_09355 [bacterium]